MHKLLKTPYPWLFVFSFGLLSFNAYWGLPSAKRLELIGGNTYLSNNLSQIITAKNNAKQIGTSKLPRNERILFATREFLISPWAGDDNFTLNAIKQFNPSKLKFDPHFYMYGGGFIYGGATFIQLAAWLGIVTLKSDATFYLHQPAELGAIFGVLRFAVVLFATLGICIAYYIAQKHFSNRVAYLATGLILAMPVTHQTVRAVEPHIFVLPYFLLAILFMLDATSSNPKKNYLWAAVFSGAAIGTQATSFYLIFPFFASLYINYAKKQLTVIQIVKYFALFAVVSTGVLLLINPYYVLNFEGFMKDFGRGTGNQVLGSFKNWAPFQLGWFLLVVFLSAVIYHILLKPKRDAHIIALACVLPAILVYIFVGNYHMPYIFSSLAIFAMLAAQMFDRGFNAVKHKQLRWSLVTILSLLFLLNTIGRSVYYMRNFTAEHREAAGAWINTNVPKDATVAVRFPPSVWDCVPFEFSNYTLVDLQTLSSHDTLPDYLVMSNATESETIRAHYDPIQVYLPKTFLGYRFEVDGELHALIAKTIRIYARKSSSH